MGKYIFVNGVMKVDPNYKSQDVAQGSPSTVADQTQALAVVSSTNDIAEATAIQEKATGKPMQLSDATVSSMQIIQDKDFVDSFRTSQKLDGGNLLDGISNVFAQYEVPIGLLNKLLALQLYDLLNFKIDDSGSMRRETDALLSQATIYTKAKVADKNRLSNPDAKMTRWEEAEDRLHIMIDMLAYLPIKKIKLSFLNRSNEIILTHEGKTPEAFAKEAHQKISEAFAARMPTNDDRTPLKKHLTDMFNTATGNTMHYLLTDGEPSDASTAEIGALVITRKNPQQNPLTFLSCTDDENEAAWMKVIEEVAPFTAELDDFLGERKEVLTDQGPAFPYTKGFWLLCNLVAAINPDDLDAIDESYPFTKCTLDNLLGRVLGEQEYQQYFYKHPKASQFSAYYSQFSRTDIVAGQIDVVQHEKQKERNQLLTSSPYAAYLRNMPPAYAAATSQPSYYGANQAPVLWAQPASQAVATNYAAPPPPYSANNNYRY